MHLKKRLTAVAAVLVMTAAVLYGSVFGTGGVEEAGGPRAGAGDKGKN